MRGLDAALGEAQSNIQVKLLRETNLLLFLGFCHVSPQNQSPTWLWISFN